MTIKPTQEQLDILEAFKANKILKVNSVAGAGKTSTLKMLAEDNPEKSLYICFNKAIADEASSKFPEHVLCKTTHAVAYNPFGVNISHKLKRPVGPYKNVAGTASEIARYFKIKDFEVNQFETIRAVAIATFVKFTVKRFQTNVENSISQKHLPKGELLELQRTHFGINIEKLQKIILQHAKTLWKERCDPESPVLADHDTYMKLWQLSNPHLNYDILYVDEAQDSNPVLLDVVKKQSHCKVMYVGDTYQSIYEFRNAKNAMELISAPTKVLSKSFRYGSKIANVAKYIINNEIDVKGLETLDSKVGAINSEKYTKLFRTNAALLEDAVYKIGNGGKVYCAISHDEFVKKLSSADALYNKDMKNVKDESITPYSTWLELKEAAKEDPELQRLVKIVESYRVEEFLSAFEKLIYSEKEADIILTTAHKSKGKEWSNVVIADDFDLSKVFGPKRNQQEVNLLYVACTRAIDNLQLSDALEEEIPECKI